MNLLEKQTVCAFTGHRSLKGDVELNDIKAVAERLIGEGIHTFYNGMAVGFDLMAAAAVVGLKEKYPQIKMIACIPCPEQNRFYKEENREEYRKIMEKCDDVIVLSDRYYKGCMQARDRYMADKCDVLVAYLREKKGGTYYTVRYAASKGKEILYL